MALERLHLVDFRAFRAARFEPHPTGTTALVGPNGAGKTSLLEALAYAGTLRSFRGAPRPAMVRRGAPAAVVRAELARDGSLVLVEASIAADPGALPAGEAPARTRVQLNRQSNPGRRDLADAVPVTVFSPEDLALVQGAPQGRRDLLDDALALLDRPAAALVDQVERVLRQRGALLRQAKGRAGADVLSTLEVWDARLAEAGEALGAARRALLEALAPLVAASYAALAGATACTPWSGPGGPDGPVTLAYRASWAGPLHAALGAARDDDLRRGVTTVGPHRDDVEIRLEGREARTQASQGEQRSLALALRLAVHRLAAERRGAVPILLLDDVFSELDPARSRALVAQLPGGQTLLTTAGPLPPDVAVDEVVDVATVATDGPAPAAAAGR